MTTPRADARGGRVGEALREPLALGGGLLRGGLGGLALVVDLAVVVLAAVGLRRPSPWWPASPACVVAAVARLRRGGLGGLGRRGLGTGRLAQCGAGLAGRGLCALRLGRLAGRDAGLGGLRRGGLAGQLGDAARGRACAPPMAAFILRVRRDLRRAAAFGWIAPAFAARSSADSASVRASRRLPSRSGSRRRSGPWRRASSRRCGADRGCRDGARPGGRA